MPGEPVLTFLRGTGWSWVWLWLGYGAFTQGISLLLCWLTGGSENVRAYLSDRVELLWPWLVVAPAPALYIILDTCSIRLSDSITALSGTAPTWGVREVFWPASAVVLALLVLMIDWHSIRRFERVHPDLWFLRPKILIYIRRLLFAFPYGYMIAQFVLRLLLQWITLVRFLRSAGLDYSSLYFHPDGFFGLAVIRDLFFLEAVLVILASFLPTPMLLRESGEGHAWQYRALFLAGVTISLVWIILLSSAFNGLLRELHASAVVEFAGTAAQAESTEALLRQLVDLRRLDIIRQQPQTLVWPVGLTGIASLRAVVFVLELYALGVSLFEFPTLSKTTAKVRSALFE
jgi:hypothetical protein